VCLLPSVLFSNIENCLSAVSSDSCSCDEIHIRSHNCSRKGNFVLHYVQQVETLSVNVHLLGVFKLDVMENCFCMTLVFTASTFHMFCIIDIIADCLLRLSCIVRSLCWCFIWERKHHPCYIKKKYNFCYSETSHNYRIFGLCPLFSVLKTKHCIGHWIFFCLQVSRRHLLCWVP
jgi:hypothetical protein